MKKKVLALLMLVVMIATCVIVATPEASAQDNHDNDHCICGGDAVGKTGHNCADYVNVTWTAWPENSVPTAGYYYLTKDTTLEGVAVGAGTAGINITGDLYICLNGHKLSTDADWIFTTQVTSTAGKRNTKLVICDCGNGGSVVNTQVKANDEDKLEQGAIVRHQGVNNLLDITIFDGAFSATTKRESTTDAGGALFSVKSSAGSVKGDKAYPIFTIYGGTFSGGETVGQGGLIFMNGQGELHIHGGTFTDGTSGSHSGLIHMGHGRTKLVITDGIFSNGQTSATGAGGLISATSGNTDDDTTGVYISGGTFSNGQAKLGGLFHFGGKAIITGGTFSDGQATTGGLIYKDGDAQVAVLDITGGSFTDGEATESGGIIYKKGTRPALNINGAVISGGIAPVGSNVCVGTGPASVFGVDPATVVGADAVIGKITLDPANNGLGIQLGGKVEEEEIDVYKVKFTLENAVAHEITLFDYENNIDDSDEDYTFTVWLADLLTADRAHGNEKLTVQIYTNYGGTEFNSAVYTTSMSALIAEAAAMSDDLSTAQKTALAALQAMLPAAN